MKLFDLDIPFKLSKNLLNEFYAYCDESHSEDEENEPNSLEYWFCNMRKTATDEEITAKFERLTS